MSFKDLLGKTLTSIIRSKGQAAAVVDFAIYLDKNGWPIEVTKSEVIKAIDLILAEKLPADRMSDMINLLIGQQRVAIKLTKPMQRHLRKIIDLVKKARDNSCEHKHLVMATFMHGGGFCMPSQQPELICLDCNLNVTLFTYLGVEKFKVLFGIDITVAKLIELKTWAEGCKNVYSSNSITDDPKAAYERTDAHWKGDFPFKIVDVSLLNSMSGK